MDGKKVRILCLDGGGIRGIIPASIMQYVEEKLIELSKNPNTRISDYFDMIVGTSTGGILGCFYLMPHPEKGKPNMPNAKFKASEALELYTKKGYLIFNQAKKKGWGGLRQLFNATQYSPKDIETIFQENFADTYYNELLQRCIITTFDMKGQKAFFFNNQESGGKQKERRFLVRDVARSTSAAPTYFPPAIIKNLQKTEEMVNIDGGVFANDPTLCAYAEARTTNFLKLGINRPSAKDMLILSIGTGSQRLDLKDFYNAGGWGVISWAKTIPNIMMFGGLDTVNYQANLLFDTLEGEEKRNYMRIDVPKSLRGLDENSKEQPIYNADMSDASASNIKNLVTVGAETLKQANDVTKTNGHTLDNFISKVYEIGPT